MRTYENDSVPKNQRHRRIAQEGFVRTFGSGNTKADRAEAKRVRRKAEEAEAERLNSNQKFFESLVRARSSGDLGQIANALKVLDIKQKPDTVDSNVGYLDVPSKDIFNA